MEGNYFIINDNIDEIVLITYCSKLSFRICLTAKSTFNYFYNIPMIHVHFYLKYPGSLQLSKFKQVKELNFGKSFRLNESYNEHFKNLTNIHTLRIDCTITNPNLLCLTTLTNLSSLSFRNFKNQNIKFYSRSIRKLTATNYLNSSRFSDCKNLEELNLKTNNDGFFFIYTYTNLTKLVLQTVNISHPICFNGNYFDYLLELSIFDTSIDLSKCQYPDITSLTILNIRRDITLSTLNNLRSLTLERADHINEYQVKIKNMNYLTYLHMKEFNILNIDNIFGKYVSSLSEFRGYVPRDSEKSSVAFCEYPYPTRLKILNIQHKYAFHIDLSDMNNLCGVKSVMLNDQIFNYLPDVMMYLRKYH